MHLLLTRIMALLGLKSCFVAAFSLYLVISYRHFSVSLNCLLPCWGLRALPGLDKGFPGQGDQRWDRRRKTCLPPSLSCVRSDSCCLLSHPRSFHVACSCLCLLPSLLSPVFPVITAVHLCFSWTPIPRRTPALALEPSWSLFCSEFSKDQR